MTNSKILSNAFILLMQKISCWWENRLKDHVRHQNVMHCKLKGKTTTHRSTITSRSHPCKVQCVRSIDTHIYVYGSKRPAKTGHTNLECPRLKLNLRNYAHKAVTMLPSKSVECILDYVCIVAVACWRQQGMSSFTPVSFQNRVFTVISPSLNKHQ